VIDRNPPDAAASRPELRIESPKEMDGGPTPMRTSSMHTTPNVSTLIDANLEAGREQKTSVITADDRELTFGDL
jgi:hypothetical protein